MNTKYVIKQLHKVIEDKNGFRMSAPSYQMEGARALGKSLYRKGVTPLQVTGLYEIFFYKYGIQYNNEIFQEIIDDKCISCNSILVGVFNEKLKVLFIDTGLYVKPIMFTQKTFPTKYSTLIGYRETSFIKKPKLPTLIKILNSINYQIN